VLRFLVLVVLATKIHKVTAESFGLALKPKISAHQEAITVHSKPQFYRQQQKNFHCAIISVS